MLSGLGDNWALALVETELEGFVLLDFVETSDNVPDFLIGGSTNRNRSFYYDSLIWPEDYRIDNKGLNKSNINPEH